MTDPGQGLSSGRASGTLEGGTEFHDTGMGAVAIAISADGDRFVSGPLGSRHPHSFATEALIDPVMDDAVSATFADAGNEEAGAMVLKRMPPGPSMRPATSTMPSSAAHSAVPGKPLTMIPSFSGRIRCPWHGAVIFCDGNPAAPPGTLS